MRVLAVGEACLYKSCKPVGQNSAPRRVVGVPLGTSPYIRWPFFLACIARLRGLRDGPLARVVAAVRRLLGVDVDDQGDLRPNCVEESGLPSFESSLQRPQQVVDGLQASASLWCGRLHVDRSEAGNPPLPLEAPARRLQGLAERCGPVGGPALCEPDVELLALCEACP